MVARGGVKPPTFRFQKAWLIRKVHTKVAGK